MEKSIENNEFYEKINSKIIESCESIHESNCISFFAKDGKTIIGKLIIKEDVITFEGSADESAKVFFNAVKGFVDMYIKTKSRVNDNYLGHEPKPVTLLENEYFINLYNKQHGK